jgi:FkbM family methyltransferase
MLKLIGEKIKEGTLLKSINKTITGYYKGFIKKVKHHNAHYFLDSKRVFTKELLGTFPKIDERHIEVGNYFLDKRLPLNSESIVYSIGILTEISFDIAVAEKFDSQVFMYDPTPVSIDFMKQYEGHRNFHFFPFGVWIENTILKFYLPNDAGSASIMSENNKGKYFEANCKTLQTLMTENQHDRIDVLKMDIEGAALPILEEMEKAHIYPNQIVVELERPSGDIQQNIDFFHRVLTLCNKLEAKDYEIFALPRAAYSYYCMELLFVKKSEIK